MVTPTSERIKHLEFIQATIARQASHSFAIKGWSLTVATAVYAFTAANLDHWWLPVVALLPVIAFAWLDQYYLRQERLFRELYKECIAPDTEVPLFSMDTGKYTDIYEYPNCRSFNVIKSSTWWILHFAIATVGMVLLGVAVF